MTWSFLQSVLTFSSRQSVLISVVGVGLEWAVAFCFKVDSFSFHGMCFLTPTGWALICVELLLGHFDRKASKPFIPLFKEFVNVTVTIGVKWVFWDVAVEKSPISSSVSVFWSAAIDRLIVVSFVLCSVSVMIWAFFVVEGIIITNFDFDFWNDPKL